ncbi:peptidase M50 [Desulfotomaculum nigrificans CO-1-SRB]|uniref:Peptidase M50 n=2 Tax=Desulfotomaculum nigrificans TaxID=1565 RepID=F6B9A6_DESCC|nr:peptidase M50 [Desulfotomaculum nigrificans CO-1-SRB]
MFNFPSARELVLMALPILLALTFHEFAHAWVAHKLGDNTAKNMGRLTLNPLKHLDPIGTLLLFLAGFGWAKPVPVNPWNFDHPKKGMMLVSLAGPVTNMLLAILGTVLFGLLTPAGNLFAVLQYFIYINVILAVFNFLPMPPLDGSKILAGILPGRQEWLDNLERYGSAILLFLIILGLLNPILNFFINPIMNMLNALAVIIARVPL